ncbi:DUF4440 domain-containing protein [Undibacterium terreum]|nr:nuclear transport factor 2 family protein [Undibacterium terreum]
MDNVFMTWIKPVAPDLLSTASSQSIRKPIARISAAIRGKASIALASLALIAAGAMQTANAATPQEEASAFFLKFAAAQNAHDIAAVRALLWDSPDFLWVTRGVQIRGAKAALDNFSSYYSGTWQLEPEMDKLSVRALTADTMQILVPVVFTRGNPGQTPQKAKFLISQTLIRAADGWHVATILPVADTQLK